MLISMAWILYIYGQVMISIKIVYGLRINCHLYIIIYGWCLYGHIL